MRHSCDDFNSYRAARVKSLFNCESGANFSIDANLPVGDPSWSLGLIVGPSGSGKTSLGQKFFGDDAIYSPEGWPADAPIVDAIAPQGDFNDVTAALAAVGLGSVPAWLRPYRVLSNGERFRADLARIICETASRHAAQVVVDEFTSVVDRQIAKMGALAFQKSWRRAAKRTGAQCVLLSCHYDIAEWLEPDWIFDTATGKFSGRSLRRPSFELEIFETNWRHWPLFEPHYYLKLPHMIAAQCYVATVNGEMVAHVAVAPRPGLKAMRASRLVVMPEWQGAGVGLRFLNAVCEMQRVGQNRYGVRVPTYFHTSHPGLCAVLRRDPAWMQVSAILYGQPRKAWQETINASALRGGWEPPGKGGHGGHFRAVQGFCYRGAQGVQEKIAEEEKQRIAKRVGNRRDDSRRDENRSRDISRGIIAQN